MQNIQSVYSISFLSYVWVDADIVIFLLSINVKEVKTEKGVTKKGVILVKLMLLHLLHLVVIFFQDSMNNFTYQVCNQLCQDLDQSLLSLLPIGDAQVATKNGSY